MKVLDIGCGDRKEFWDGDGIDMFDYGQKYIFDVSDYRAWTQISDNSYDKVKAQHILEHIHGLSFIPLLNNIWRVGKPGALFVGEAPHWTSPNFFRDPFHVKQISEHTFDAFLEGSQIHFGPGYNVQCKFRPIGHGIYVNTNRDVVWTLEIVK